MEKILIEERLLKNCSLSDLSILKDCTVESELENFCKMKHCKFMQDDYNCFQVFYKGFDSETFYDAYGQYLRFYILNELKNADYCDGSIYDEKEIVLSLTDDEKTIFNENTSNYLEYPLFWWEWLEDEYGEFNDLRIVKRCWYKNYCKEYIGGSDCARLIFASPEKLQYINFGEDGNYSAYILDSEGVVGGHYELTATFHDWLKIYDDDKKVIKFKADKIEVWQAGNFGIIIKLFNNKEGVTCD